MEKLDLNGKIILITGGTGSIGKVLCEKFANTNVKEIRIFSRNISKQEKMQREIKKEKIKYFIGDVRDYESVFEVMKNVDYLIHSSAMKSIPDCEANPIEAFQINVIGSNNVIKAATQNKVKKALFLSTDKCVNPISIMGYTKALMEKIVVSESKKTKDTVFSVARLGNIMFTEKSVIPLFNDLIDEGKPLTITDGSMTRFMMSVDDVFDLCYFAFLEGKNGDIIVKKAPSVKIDDLAKSIIELKNKDVKIIYIGARLGEKKDEVLITKEEMMHAKEFRDYYRINII